MQKISPSKIKTNPVKKYAGDLARSQVRVENSENPRFTTQVEYSKKGHFTPNFKSWVVRISQQPNLQTLVKKLGDNDRLAPDLTQLSGCSNDQYNLIHKEHISYGDFNNDFNNDFLI